MNRVAAAGGLIVALVGCSAEPASRSAADEHARAPSERVSAPVAVAKDGDNTAGAIGTRGGLTGQVSALTGAVSGLDTRITDMGLVIDLPADALFEFDKATLTPVAEVELNKAAELIRRSPAGPIQVIGHTDAKGDDAYNQRLSEARAKTVADWFGQQVGVRTRQFQVSGKGEAAPIAPNARPDGGDDAAGRAKNRRVEVVVPKP